MLTTQLTTEDTITIPRAEYEDLKRQLAEFQRLIFGRKSERFIPANLAQTSLFEQSAEDQAEAPTLTPLPQVCNLWLLRIERVPGSVMNPTSPGARLYRVPKIKNKRL
ncbi:MAG: transposase [Bacteroidota bacterium]